MSRIWTHFSASGTGGNKKGGRNEKVRRGGADAAKSPLGPPFKKGGKSKGEAGRQVAKTNKKPPFRKGGLGGFCAVYCG